MAVRLLKSQSGKGLAFGEVQTERGRLADIASSGFRDNDARGGIAAQSRWSEWHPAGFR